MLELPTVARPGPDAAVRRPPAAAGPPAARRLDILLVEDNKDTLNYLALMLWQSRPRACRTAATRRPRPSGPSPTGREFDLLISDIELPDGTGLEIDARPDGRGRRVPAIAMSGFGSEDDIRLSLEPASSST